MRVLGCVRKMEGTLQVVRVGGVKYTIKDGVIFDAKLLLNDVKKMVKAAKTDEDFEIIQPGMEKVKN